MSEHIRRPHEWSASDVNSGVYFCRLDARIADAFSIALTVAATLAPTGRSWGEFFDLFMRIVAYRANIRWDKSRPWIPWSAISLAVMFFLAFAATNFREGKMVSFYSVVTYIHCAFSKSN